MSLALRSPEQDTADAALLGLSEGQDHLPQPSGHAFPNAPQDTIGLPENTAGSETVCCSLGP